MPTKNEHETGALVPIIKDNDPLPRQGRGSEKGTLVPAKTINAAELTAVLLFLAHTGRGDPGPRKTTFNLDAV